MWAALRYYEDQGGVTLGDRFFAEFEGLVRQFSTDPRKFHFAANRTLRRANLARFPYHLFFRETAGGIRVLVLRHHKRQPEFGLGRK